MIAIKQETLHHSLETSVKLEHFHFVLIAYTSKAINVIHEVKTTHLNVNSYIFQCLTYFFAQLDSRMFWKCALMSLNRDDTDTCFLTNTKIYVNPFTIKTTVA